MPTTQVLLDGTPTSNGILQYLCFVPDTSCCGRRNDLNEYEPVPDTVQARSLTGLNGYFEQEKPFAGVVVQLHAYVQLDQTVQPASSSVGQCSQSTRLKDTVFKLQKPIPDSNLQYEVYIHECTGMKANSKMHD